MSEGGKLSWRSLLGCRELCFKATEDATEHGDVVEDFGPRASTIMLSQLIVGLPPKQVSRRIGPVDNTASALDEVVIWPVVGAENSPIYYSSSNNYDTLQKQEDLQQLWKEAIDKFEASPEGMKLSSLLQAQKQINTEDSTIELSDLLANLEGQMKRFGLRGKTADTVAKVAPHINRIAIVGDVAVSANPMPAALPWAAVRFILLNVTAGEEIRVKIFEGIAEIITLIFECSVYREFYLTAEDTKSLSAAKKLRKAIIETLCQCIKFLAFTLRRQQAFAKALTDAFRLEDFSGYLKDLYTVKLQLHDAGSLCEMYRSSHGRELVKDLHRLIVDMRKASNQRLEQEAKSKLRDLLLDPKDALDHIQHPANSFCLRLTRQTVIRDIFDWAEDGESPTICWLPGLAGTRKSTVSRTVARDLKYQCLGGCFFFKKGASNRANGRTIFSIIAYQLALNFPPVRQHVIDVIQEDLASVMGSMNDQWRTLIREPLDKVEDREFARNVVLVIDALDECDKDDRQSILTILTTCPDTLKVFITSRPEFDIEAYFARQKQFHREISLHRVKTVDIESDITMFLRHRISAIVTEHNACYPQKELRLEQDWPGSERFQILIKRSVPLFIAAATFIRMIENISWAESPNSKLNMIIETSNQVGSAYETIYKPVLSLISGGAPDEAQAKSRNSFIDIIGSIILLANPLSMASLASLLDVDVRDVASLINPLRSVLKIPRDGSPINLFHLSFRDFLLGKSAGDLQVDEATTHAKLSDRCLKHLERELRTDICDLGSPGRSRFNIVQDTINQKIPQETQYACRYWVHHVIGSEKQLKDNDEGHQFLKRFFLNWIEVLCLTGQFFESPNMLQELLKIVNKTSGSEIFKFVQDAIRFIHFFRYGIEETPLQLYHSGILFSPTSSIAPQPFEDRRCPKSVMRLPAVDSDWPQSVQSFDVGREALKMQLAVLSSNLIITWGFYADIKIWNISSGSCIQTLQHGKVESSQYPAIGWFLEGSLLAIGRGGKIDIWNSKSRSFINCLLLDGRSVRNIAFSNDGTFLCSISKIGGKWHSEPVLFIHDLDSGECTNKFIWLSAWDSSNSLDWINLGRQEYHDPHIQFTSDGSLLAVTSEDGCVRTWHTGTKRCIGTLQYPYTGEIHGLSLTKDWLAASSHRQQTVVFDLKTGKFSYEMGKIATGSLAISTDAKLLATVSEGETVRVWNFSPQQSTRVGIFHPNAVEFLTVTSDESTVISACRNQVKTWDVSSGQCIETLGESYPMEFRTATDDGSHCVMTSGRGIEVWSRNPWRLVKSLQRKEESFVNSFETWAITKNGELLTIPVSQYNFFTRIRKIEIWDVHSGSIRQTLSFSLPAHAKVVFSPDGSLIAYTTEDSIEIHQISESCKLLIRIGYVDAFFLYTSLSFHGQNLVAISMEGDVRVWDTETGELSAWCQTVKAGLRKSFINYEVLLGNVGTDVHLRQEVLKESQVSDDKSWITRGGERLLWLPPDYRPSVYSDLDIVAYTS